MKTWICAVFALTTIASLQGCTTNPSTGRSQFLPYSPEETAAMGEEAKPELIAEYGGEVPSAELREYIEDVGKKLVKQVEPEYDGIKWEFTTLDSDVINAFALPGGKVFISRGILQQFQTEAEVAAVLGHEVGHVTGRHVDERLGHALIVSGIAATAGVAAGSSDSNWAQAVPVIVGVGGQGYLLKFGRDQENEADMQGLKYMTRAGYTPQGMIDVINVLIEASKGGSPPEILSTHPNPESRLRDVKAEIESSYASMMNNPEYKDYKSRFEKRAVPHFKATKSASAESGPDRRGVVDWQHPVTWCAICAATPRSVQADD